MKFNSKEKLLPSFSYIKILVKLLKYLYTSFYKDISSFLICIKMSNGVKVQIHIQSNTEFTSIIMNTIQRVFRPSTWSHICVFNRLMKNVAIPQGWKYGQNSMTLELTPEGWFGYITVALIPYLSKAVTYALPLILLKHFIYLNII